MRNLKKYVVMFLCLIVLFQTATVFADDDYVDANDSEVYHSEGVDSDVTVIQEDDFDISLFSTTKSFSWSIENNVEKKSTAFSLKKGSVVKLKVYFSKTTNVTVGIVDGSGKRTYVYAKSELIKSLTAPSGGTYRFFVKNKSGSKITVSGSYSW